MTNTAKLYSASYYFQHIYMPTHACTHARTNARAHRGKPYSYHFSVRGEQVGTRWLLHDCEYRTMHTQSFMFDVCD